MRKTSRLFIVIIIILILIGGTIFAIKFAKGYRPSLQNKRMEGTGLLAANSTPRGASVFINDKLTTATDDTLNLPPKEYKIRIAKDGYIPWEKNLKLEPELVSQTNARLFPSVPNLKPLTFSGALNPIPSPDGQKIIFAVANATTDAKNGLYILDLLDRPFSLNSDPKQISRSTANMDLINSRLRWSPDASQILATINPGKFNERNILLNPNIFNDLAESKDVSAQLPVILKDWNEIINKKNHELLKTLPDKIQEIATTSAILTAFSPDEEKFLYLATASAQIPLNLIPVLPASSTQPEERNIEPDNYYIYDSKEDKNFLIGKAVQDIPVIWYFDSRHIVTVDNEKILILEYDATNRSVVYAGPFSHNFVFPWPDGSRLVIMASLNGGSNLPPNLYSINLK